MSDTTPAEPSAIAAVSDDLDTFAAELFGKTKAPEPASPEAETEDHEDNDASNDTLDKVDDTDLPDDDDSNEESETSKSKKKTRFQDRIDELTAKAKNAERERDELREKLKGQNPDPVETPKPAPKPAAELVEPTPYDVNEDGTEKYELGEFDPKYIKDLTKFALLSEKAAIEAEDARKAEIAQMDTEKAELEESWRGKLPDATERYPDFQEKGQSLIDIFQGINEAYGEYLSATIMSLENGPDVLYYLSSNVDEAKKIVNAGPSRATIMLGKLDAYFEDSAKEEEQPTRKVSKAPTPPPQNKGVAVARSAVPDDTDDLDAFSRKLFDKRRRRS